MFRIQLQCLRFYAISSQEKFLRKREARMLQKIMRKSEIARAKEKCIGSQWTSFKDAPSALNLKANHKITALNKIVMGHIADLLPNDVFGDELDEYGIEITKVNVTSNFNFINVYWINNKKHADDKLYGLLQSAAGKLRFQLSVLKVMASVPQIRFVQDRRLVELREIDALLNKVSSMNEKFPEVNSDEIDPNIVADFECQDMTYKLPTMSNCVLNVDVKKILENIELAKQRAHMEKPFMGIDIQWDKVNKTEKNNVWEFDKKTLSKVVKSKMYEQKKVLKTEKRNMIESVEKLITEEDSSDECDDEYDEREYYSDEDGEDLSQETLRSKELAIYPEEEGEKQN